MMPDTSFKPVQVIVEVASVDPPLRALTFVVVVAVEMWW
jgi:hypothetical protein